MTDQRFLEISSQPSGSKFEGPDGDWGAEESPAIVATEEFCSAADEYLRTDAAIRRIRSWLRNAAKSMQSWLGRGSLHR